MYTTNSKSNQLVLSVTLYVDGNVVIIDQLAVDGCCTWWNCWYITSNLQVEGGLCFIESGRWQRENQNICLFLNFCCHERNAVVSVKTVKRWKSCKNYRVKSQIVWGQSRDIQFLVHTEHLIRYFVGQVYISFLKKIKKNTFTTSDAKLRKTSRRRSPSKTTLKPH